jgi:ubiquinone/menaquinone biosynthesis C-methylase UbiE
MNQCLEYFVAHPCRRVLDVGCGFGRWAQYIVGHGVAEVVGVDYAEGGIRAASAWAGGDRRSTRFAVGSAMALPFRRRPFDGVLAALLLDNLNRSDCLTAVRSLNAVTQPGARGFFVFNPAFTAAELATVPDDNPTKGCMHVVYEDAELPARLPGWSITRLGCTAEGFRVVEATFQS